MKIGADVKREARIEEQRRKSKEDKLKRVRRGGGGRGVCWQEHETGPRRDRCSHSGTLEATQGSPSSAPKGWGVKVLFSLAGAAPPACPPVANQVY